MLSGKLLESIGNTIYPGPEEKDTKKYGVPLLTFFGRTIINGAPVVIGGYVGRNAASTRTGLRVVSIPEHFMHRGGQGLAVRSREVTLRPGEYPVYATSIDIRVPPDGGRETTYFSVPLYEEVAPSVNAWPLDLLVPSKIWEEHVGERPSLPPDFTDAANASATEVLRV